MDDFEAIQTQKGAELCQRRMFPKLDFTFGQSSPPN
jgi:hypothetical protein